MYIDRSDGQARRIEPARRTPKNFYCDSERYANLLCVPIGILDGQRPPKGDRTKALIGRARRPPKNGRYRRNNEARQSTDRAGHGGRARTNGPPKDPRWRQTRRQTRRQTPNESTKKGGARRTEKPDDTARTQGKPTH